MKLSLNLATRSYLNRRAIYFSSIAVTAVLFGLLAFNLYNYSITYDRVAQLDERLTELEAQAKDLPGSAIPKLDAREQEQLLADIEFANQTLNADGFRWTSLLDRLEALVPSGVAIHGIRPDFKKGSFDLTASAASIEDLRKFLDNFIESPDFNDVYLLQQARQENKTDGKLLNFSIVVKGAF